MLWIDFILLGITCQKFDAKYFKAAYLGVILSLKAFYVFEWKKFLKSKSWINRISFFNIRYEIARRYMQKIIIHTRITWGHIICWKVSSLKFWIVLFRYKPVQCLLIYPHLFFCILKAYILFLEIWFALSEI